MIFDAADQSRGCTRPAPTTAGSSFDLTCWMEFRLIDSFEAPRTGTRQLKHCRAFSELLLESRDPFYICFLFGGCLGQASERVAFAMSATDLAFVAAPRGGWIGK